MILSPIDSCEVCGSRRLTSVLDLGLHPLCDDLVPIGDARVCREYPIEILFCQNCRTAHQRFQLPKRDLFPATYHYRSRFTADVLNGMAELVDSCAQRFGDLKGKTVLDIGCNDGSLLDYFRARGAITLGVEPTNASSDAEGKGHTIFCEYLSGALADTIVGAHGRPDFITFTNVFAHVENLREVNSSLQRLIGKQTVVVIENHYLGSVLDSSQFDTFYHEHSRTYSYTSFLHIAESLNVSVLEAEFPARYGGNIRVFLGHGHWRNQKADGLPTSEEQFAARFELLREDLRRWRERKPRDLQKEFEEFGRLPAKAFPARAAILIKLVGLDEDSLSAVYEKPGSMKIAHYVPGTRIPIRSDDELFGLQDRSRPLLNLAWHIPQEIRAYLRARGYAGPVIDIVNSEDFGARHTA